MADPHNNPLTVEAMDLPGARRILPDPLDTGEAMRIGEEKESSCCGETTGCSGVGEGSTEVTPPSLDCTMPPDDSQDCASARSTTVKDNAAHGSAPPAPEGEGAPTGTAAAESEGAHVAPAAPESEDVPAGTAAAAPPVGEGAPVGPAPESEGTPTAPAAPVGEGAPAGTAAPESEDAPAGTESEGAVAVAAPPVGEVVPAPAAPEGEGAPPAPESEDAPAAPVGEGAPAATAAAAESEGAPAAPAAPAGVGAPAANEIQVAPSEGAASGVTSAPRLVGDECKRDWLKAIEAKDCLALLDILGKDYDKASFVKLCTETRVEGRTALHVAAMQGCFRLATQLLDFFRSEVYHHFRQGYAVTSRRGISDDVRLLRENGYFIYAKDGRSGLSAFEMANDIIGNTSISQFFHNNVPQDYRVEYGHTAMYEAYEGTDWHMALSVGDCTNLQQLLSCNSRFVLETCHGVSVLDVAILTSDEELLKQVMRLFRMESAEMVPELRWHKTSYYPWKIQWCDIAYSDVKRRSVSAETDFYPGVTQRKKMQNARSARDLAEKFGTSDAIKQLLRNVKEHVRGPKKGESDEDQINGNQELLRSLSKRNLFENGVAPKENGDHFQWAPLESELPEFSSLIETVREIEHHWNHEWTKDFLADVDYNFEDKRFFRFSLLRVHYACKHPCQCSTFLNQILRVGTYDWKRLVALTCDGQGRTPFHTMVDFYKPSDFNFHELAIDAVCDSRGRTPMIRAITKQFLEQDNMVFSHALRHCEEKANDAFNNRPLVHGDLFQKNGISMLQGLYLASFLYEDSNVLRLFSSEGEDLNVFKAALSRNHLDHSLHGVPLQNRALFIAATTGNQTLLREWFKFKNDCMVEDAKGRTALHYAAGSVDASIFLPTPFFCSIGYLEKMEEKLMKRHNSSVELDINGIPKSNVFVGRKACILMLLQAGVDLSQVDKEGNIPDPNTSSNIEFLGWWYDLLAKDSEDKKNSFNQAGNALSVVGTLVAATSYIGPLQPPLSYSHDGYVDSSRSLVKIFMCTNTLAFYLAVASVMFAVVPSLPMPQEGVIDELKRARHTVSSSLFLLLASIVCILVSFAAATAVVIKNGDYYGANDFLLSPSVIGWFFLWDGNGELLHTRDEAGVLQKPNDQKDI